MRSKQLLLYSIIPILFIIIYAQVWIAEYAYLDEIHQLWNNRNDSNFIMFHSQGRWLTGLLFQYFFSSILSIEQLKLFRIFSLIGWIITTLAWCRFFKVWVNTLGWPVQLWWIGSIYIVCCIPVVIFIGWASCMEVFVGVLAALASGHLFYMGLKNKERRSFLFSLSPALMLGVVSLFIYQNAFGVFLLPFLFHYVVDKKAMPAKLVLSGIAFYLLTYVVYYFLFKISLQVYDVEAGDRAVVSTDMLGKLSFFFAGPLPQGFSMNLLFSASSIFSQILYPLFIVLWLVSIFKRNKQNTVVQNIIFVAGTMLMMALIYLPSMIAKENFPSYRTLFAFNLAVFVIVTESLLYFFSSAKAKNIFAIVAIIYLVLTGAYAFNIQYVNPLSVEYKALKNFMQANFNPSINNVYFIRADKHLFTKAYGTKVYRDEFGAPSTYRDWVPEPIVRQMVYQLTSSREVAERIEVVQFENKELFNGQMDKLDNNLLINMNNVFDNYRKKTFSRPF